MKGTELLELVRRAGDPSRMTELSSDQRAGVMWYLEALEMTSLLHPGEDAGRLVNLAMEHIKSRAYPTPALRGGFGQGVAAAYRGLKGQARSR